ncbi:MAG: DUF177 domain-containing protein [Hymenobacteraceae bacterium]|nr:DUF177 domain-containing protein [Hymenobacteraceae bacterium]MDX5396616.1 DUF177 domain-containing protein [Hymenobacteraceae bacterium]MDX5512678.1 DUF177 domain-containing protein [Hymenobacteraceae bacterium]
MKAKNKYEIQVAKLSNKTHEYEFDLDDSFFELFDQNLINGGKLKANITLDKTDLLLTFTISIDGTVRLTCDRSLEEFDYPVSVTESILMKYGPEEAELDDNVYQITPNTQTVNLAQHMFDFIGLSIPMKKLHPRFRTDEYEASDNDVLVYSSGAKTTGEGNSDEDDDENDPRWDVLKNLN